MARDRHSWVVFTSFLLLSSTFPTKKVSFRSPWQPLWKTVISTGKEFIANKVFILQYQFMLIQDNKLIVHNYFIKKSNFMHGIKLV